MKAAGLVAPTVASTVASMVVMKVVSTVVATDASLADWRADHWAATTADSMVGLRAGCLVVRYTKAEEANKTHGMI